VIVLDEAQTLPIDMLLPCMAAIDELAPRDEIAVPDVPTWNRYDAPRGGRREEVHFARLRSDAAGLATAVLVGPDRHKGASLTWRAETLPCFALWKNQGGLADGYVTGLEPATNYPNPRSHEEGQGRVVPLAPGASVRFDLAIELLDEKQIAAARSTACRRSTSARSSRWAIRKPARGSHSTRWPSACSRACRS
jgi:hypothetical protein